MNKTVLLVCATIGGLAGSYVPSLVGNTDILSGWSILLGMVGGLVGIWLGVVVSKRLG